MTVTTMLGILAALLFSAYIVKKIVASKRASVNAAPPGSPEGKFIMNEAMLFTEEQYDWHNIDEEIAKHTRTNQIYRAFGLDYNGELTCVVFDDNGLMHIYFEEYIKNAPAENMDAASQKDFHHGKCISHYSYLEKEIYSCKKERVYSFEHAVSTEGTPAQHACYIIIHLGIMQSSTLKTHSIHFGPEYCGSYADIFYNKIQRRLGCTG